jgi:hypothetical protein
MKNLRFILIAAFSLMLTATSCKKEKQPEPSPAAPVAVTYSNISFDIALVDKGGSLYSTWTTVFTGPFNAYIVCNNIKIDSLTNLNVTVTTSGFMDCPISSYTALNTKSFKIQDGANNYIEVYTGTFLMGRSLIKRSPEELYSCSGTTYPLEPTNNNVTLGGCSHLMVLQW